MTPAATLDLAHSIGLEKVEAAGYGSLTLTTHRARDMAADWRLAHNDDARRAVWAEYTDHHITPERVEKIARAVLLLREEGVTL
jgi:hypothetical protein